MYVTAVLLTLKDSPSRLPFFFAIAFVRRAAARALSASAMLPNPVARASNLVTNGRPECWLRATGDAETVLKARRSMDRRAVERNILTEFVELGKRRMQGRLEE